MKYWPVGIIIVVALLLSSSLIPSNKNSFVPKDSPFNEANIESLPEPYTFVVASDGHWGYTSNPSGARTIAAINQIGNQSDVSRIFDLGDMASNTGVLQPTYNSIKALYDVLGIPYNVTSGNHDSVAFIKNTWGITTTYLMNTVIDDDIVWIYLEADIQGIEMNAIQLTYLETQLATYADNLCFILLHINHQEITSVALETNSARFGLILSNNSNHIGAVIAGHVHDGDVSLWPYYNLGKAETYYVDDIYYTYPGTYGSNYIDMNPHQRYSFLMVKVYDRDNYYTIQSWRKNIATNMTIDGTFVQYDIPGQATEEFANSDISSLWVRKNGTDPYPFNFYDGANVAPSYGMNYFDTNTIQVTWDYSFAEIDSSLFPDDCYIYLQAGYNASYYTEIADLALTDSRIRGAFIDDFEVGEQSWSNMSAIYTNLHSNDGELGYELTLGLIVYNRNYFLETPYSWYDIRYCFDIIHFWLYPFSYPSLYPCLAGYEDDFLTIRGWMPEKEYWLGIYLHYYNIGAYPIDYTREQLSIAGKLMKQGYVERISILENFWIQHHPETAILVRDWMENEYQMDYSTTWYFDSTTILSYLNTSPVYPALVTNVERTSKLSSRTSHRFHSEALQTLNVIGGGMNAEYFMITNLRNGNHQFPVWNSGAEMATYILEADQDYKIMYMKLTNEIIINEPHYIVENAWWNSAHVIINAPVYVNTTLFIQYSVVEFGNDRFNQTMFNHTKPYIGLNISSHDDARLDIQDSILEPMNRAYPFFLERDYDPDNVTPHIEYNIKIIDSVVACHSNEFYPAGDIRILDSTFFQIQPVGDTVNVLIWLECPGYINEVYIRNSIFWNYNVSGSRNLFIMPYNLYTDDRLEFDNNTVVGGEYGIEIDMAYSDTGFTLTDYHSYPAAPENVFTTFRLDGTDKEVIVETYTIFDWSIKATIPGVTFTMYYPRIESGLYTITIDNSVSQIAVTSNQLFVTYAGPWLPYRNNFSVEVYGVSFDSSDIMTDILWLMIIFMIPMVMVQFVPKIGFIAGMALSLLIFGFTVDGFLPYACMGLISVVVYTYKR